MKLNFLYRAGAVRLCVRTALVVLSLTVLAEIFVPLHAHFAVADFFSFNALYGFFSCLAMIVFAKALGKIIKRDDKYYDR